MMKEAIKFCGQYVVENGPIFIEALTYRYHGHSMSDPGVTYRTKDEISEVRQTRDPVEIAKNMIIEAGWSDAAELKQMEKDIRKQLEDEVAQIRNDPWPTEKELFSHIGATPGHFIRGVEYKNSIHPPAL